MRRRTLRQAALVIAGWLVVGGFLAPLLWMVLGSLKTPVDFLAYPPVLLFRPTLGNYAKVFADNNFPRYVLNSLIVAAGATGIGLLLGVPAAYALARYRRTGVGVILLAARMAPGIA
ncbi:MAG: carbohydrate ABC transporter permease, partial [Acetobacteraceae bacterium]